MAKAKVKAKSKRAKTSTKKANKKNVVQQPVNDSYAPSEKEIANGQKVLAILENIEDLGYSVERADLFSVIEPELGLEIIIDAEEEIVCLVAEICEQQHLEDNIENWAQKLLQINNQLLHGAFSLHNYRVLLRENLAAENLDQNELEDALSAMFTGIICYARALKLA